MLYRPGHYDVLYVRSKSPPKKSLDESDAVGNGAQSPAHQNGCSSSSLPPPLSPAASPAPHLVSATCPSPAHPGHNQEEPDSSSTDLQQQQQLPVAVSQSDNNLEQVVGSPGAAPSPNSPTTFSEANSTQPDLWFCSYSPTVSFSSSSFIHTVCHYYL